MATDFQIMEVAVIVGNRTPVFEITEAAVLVGNRTPVFEITEASVFVGNSVTTNDTGGPKGTGGAESRNRRKTFHQLSYRRKSARSGE